VSGVGGSATRVVIAGGGVAGLEALLALRRDAAGLVDLTLIAPEPEFTYRPLAVLEPFVPGSMPTLSVAEVAAEHGVALVADALAAVRTAERVAITRDGTRLPYEELVVATGAQPQPVLAGGIPLGSPADVPALVQLVEDVRAGAVRRVALVVPEGISWTLPLYELALQLGAERAADGRAPELVVVTAEESPLAAFGAEVSAEVRDLLGGSGITLYIAGTVDAYEQGAIWIEFEGAVEVDAVVALPRLRGPSIDGLAHDDDGFIPIDRVARVVGVDHIYAAGDVCAFRFKQGGLAAQEADVAAAHIAWKIGAGPQPAPLDLVLRGELLTGTAPRFLRARLPRRGEEHDDGQVSREPLWWPPAKIAARGLGPHPAAWPTRRAHRAHS
jgi:sulfide:quinone oxidoreductase